MRALAPCGTLAAYRRHLSRGEDPCAECRAANAERSRSARRKEVRIVELAPPPPPEPTRLAELQAQRARLAEILYSAEIDERSVVAVSKELRAIWAEIDDLSKTDGDSIDGLDQLAGGLSVVPLGPT